jgi:quercetin dioxygenase-like cupin family protein
MDTVRRSERSTVEAVEGVHLTQLAAGDRTSVQHYHFEPGASVPEHSHHHEQAGFVARGTLVLVVDGEDHVVDAGDSYVVPGEETHAAGNRGDEPLEGVDLFAPPRTDPDWAE